MNKSQVTYIVNTLLDDATDTITPLRKCAYFVMTKEEVKFNKDTAEALKQELPILKEFNASISN